MRLSFYCCLMYSSSNTVTNCPKIQQLKITNTHYLSQTLKRGNQREAEKWLWLSLSSWGCSPAGTAVIWMLTWAEGPLSRLTHELVGKLQLLATWSSPRSCHRVVALCLQSVWSKRENHSREAIVSFMTQFWKWPTITTSSFCWSHVPHLVQWRRGLQQGENTRRLGSLRPVWKLVTALEFVFSFLIPNQSSAIS